MQRIIIIIPSDMSEAFKLETILSRIHSSLKMYGKRTYIYMMLCINLEQIFSTHVMYGKRTYIYCSNSYYPYRAIGMDLEGVPFRRDSPRSPEALLGRWVPRWCALFPRAEMRIPARTLPPGAGEKVCTPPGTPSCAPRTLQNGCSGGRARFCPAPGGKKKPPEL